MSQTPYVFNQIVRCIPKDAFDRLVTRYGGNAFVRDYTCWRQLMVMVWAQLASRKSLRDIEVSLRAHSDKLFQLGIGHDVSRSNMAYANARRDVAIFRGIAQRMMRDASSLRARDTDLSAMME